MTGHAPGTTQTAGRIRIGISSCLLGDSVRYDGGHKRDRYITEVLSQYFDFVPYCPEVAIGLGVPRPVIRLLHTARGTRAILDDQAQSDVTDALADYGRAVGREENGNISGYILKSRSPSCGMERVMVYNRNDAPNGDGTGIYAAALRAAQPLLPVEEEGRLTEPVLRDSFIERVFVYHRWQALRAGGPSRAGLIAFHAEHEFILTAHDPQTARMLGRRLADMDADPESTAGDYIRQVMTILSKPAGREEQMNAVQYLTGIQ